MCHTKPQPLDCHHHQPKRTHRGTLYLSTVERTKLELSSRVALPDLPALPHHMFSRSSSKPYGYSGDTVSKSHRFLDIGRLGSSDSRSERSARKRGEEDWNSYSGSTSSYQENSKSTSKKSTIGCLSRHNQSPPYTTHHLPDHFLPVWSYWPSLFLIALNSLSNFINCIRP